VYSRGILDTETKRHSGSLYELPQEQYATSKIKIIIYFPTQRRLKMLDEGKICLNINRSKVATRFHPIPYIAQYVYK
jgi:hypothetical protein